MSEWSRLKSTVGGHRDPTTIASAATLTLPDVGNAFYVSGSVTITSLVTSTFVRNRRVTLIGAASANVAFTNTNTLTTAGQMYLQGANVTLNEDDVLELFCKNDGTWIIVNTTAA